MKLLELVGVGEAGNIWRVPLPDKAGVHTHGSRVLVAAPTALFWVHPDGSIEQATSYPRRLHEDNGQ